MDDIDRRHADDERRTKLRDAVKARLAGIETAILSALTDIEKIQQDMRIDMRDGHTSLYLENEQLMMKVMEHRDRLVAEHAVLEGLLDRYATRLRANIAIAIALGSIILAVINFIRQP